jgi:hypothetical protein
LRNWSHAKPEPPFDLAAVVRVAVRRAEAGNPFGRVDGGELTPRSQWFGVRIEAGPEFDAAFRRDGEEVRRRRSTAMPHYYGTTFPACWATRRRKESRTALYGVAKDEALVFLRKDWDGAINNYYFKCCLDERYDANRLRKSTEAGWLVFDLLRIWGRHFLMLQDCGDGSGHYRRIGIAEQEVIKTLL